MPLKWHHFDATTTKQCGILRIFRKKSVLISMCSTQFPPLTALYNYKLHNLKNEIRKINFEYAFDFTVKLSIGRLSIIANFAVNYTNIFVDNNEFT